MSQYFDKDFFKFLIGFAAIIIISLVIMAVLREYEVKSQIKQENSAVNVATPKP
jgi:hypothetical protein